MITASEPLEFIPRGRQAVDQHPGPTATSDRRQTFNVALSDNFLLHRLENISLSSGDNNSEFWQIQEIYDDETNERKKTCPAFLEEMHKATENEIYVRGQTAVWTKGLATDNAPGPHICFTLESPIKFAFICPDHFIKPNSKFKAFDRANESKSSYCLPESNIKKLNGLCLIDSSSLKVYLDNGEDLVSSLEFPVSKVWILNSCVILEKEASVTCIDEHSIAMPRLFSLGHPLDELCPIIVKTSPVDAVQYFYDLDLQIVFSEEALDLILLYDRKSCKNCVYRLRLATAEEITYVAETAEQQTDLFSTNTASKVMPSSIYLRNSSKFNHTTLNSGKSASLGNVSMHQMSKAKHLIASPLASVSNYPKPSNSPLSRLQSSVRRSSVSVKDARILGQAERSKPLEPKYCLERVWMDPDRQETISDAATKAFFHTDCLGRYFICYLLPAQGKLQFLSVVNPDKPSTMGFEMKTSISAKDAVSIKSLNLIAILDHSGTLMLYTGLVFVAKVHIGGVLSNLATSEHFTAANFPRRSSLLPTVHQEARFEEDFHLLSPVTPVFNKNIFMSKSTGYCVGLRDPAGNRLSLVCQGNRMYRISLPLFSESQLIARTLMAIREVLPGHLAASLIVKWYGVRNAPGSLEFSPRKEWFMLKNVLLGLLGRPPTTLESDTNPTYSAEKPRKRRKGENEDQGSDLDWEFLVTTKYGRRHINVPTSSEKSPDKSSELIKEFPALFRVLHLLYEDLKLDSTMFDGLECLGEFLYEITMDCNLQRYSLHYCMDFPKFIQLLPREITSATKELRIASEELAFKEIPCVFNSIYNQILSGNPQSVQYPYIKHINTLSRRILVFLQKFYGNKVKSSEQQKSLRFRSKKADPYLGVTWNLIERLPFGIKFLIIQVLVRDKENPRIGLKRDSYSLIRRPDLMAHSKQGLSESQLDPRHPKEDSLTIRADPIIAQPQPENAAEAIQDGMENTDTLLLRLRFPKDLRIMEVRRLLDSASPVPIDVVQAPNVTDHDFIEEKERQLFALCTRTMALSIGRGMFTLRTSAPVSTKSLPVPNLCLSGKETHNGATVDLTQIDVPSNMNLWPQFHNGVAAGLKISPEAKDVDSTWIVYNKPRVYTSTKHSGFLMALGLNGHLTSLSFMSIYDYLVRCDEMTSIGLLLGISAAHCGTMDNSITKILSVHIEALLPPTALELEIQQNVRIAALMGIGLVYQGSAKRHIAEILLQEIGRPPGPEMENSVERESYSLTAGLALGLVTLGLGETPTELQDLEIADTLHYYIIGGNKRPIVGAQKEKYKLPSFQIREGDSVNIDVTAPGATLALGLMFLQTNNRAVANWLMPPDTTYLLDFVRPDILLLRIIARGLILWSDIQPSKKWLNEQIPSILRFDLKRGPPIDESQHIDDEAYCQAYCNIVTGSIFCIGLKYAGTAKEEAYQLMKETLNSFLAMSGQYVGEYAGKTTVESCLMMIVISMSLVFAGTGDLNVLKIVRSLRSRIGPTNTHVTYGSHMALHMALGFLFLGAGRYTLSTTPKSIAALVCSLFPKFPIHSNDNRYHLQAFRHLYVLAIDPRLFLPRDVDTGRLTLSQITCIRADSEETTIELIAPCMLPELDKLKAVILSDSHYWPIRFNQDKNWQQLKYLLQKGFCVDLKKKSGCLSLLDDPNRMKSIMIKTLTAEQMSTWKMKGPLSHKKSPMMGSVCEFFLETNETPSKSEEFITEQIKNNYYHCLALDCTEMLPTFTSYVDTITAAIFRDTFCVSSIWQVKIITRALRSKMASSLNSSSKELLMSFEYKMTKTLQNLVNDHPVLGPMILQFISAANMDFVTATDLSMFEKMIAIVLFFDLTPSLDNSLAVPSFNNPLELLVHMKSRNMNTKAVQLISSLLRKV